jgi:putative ABC transport system substrate-binding protein
VTRREFITLLGGAAAWPVAARAQQSDVTRRIGVLMNLAADDAESQARDAAFLQGLQEAGWAVGRKLLIDYRWRPNDGDSTGLARLAAELVGAAPDVILAVGASSVSALQEATRSLPIVFVNVIDPIGAGFVESLSRPGGNLTGFTIYDYGISSKWLELLKEVTPALMRVAVLRDPGNPVAGGQLGAIQAVAPALGVEVTPMGVRNADEIERAVTSFAREPKGGLIATGTPLTLVHRHLIIALAARYKLPAVYFNRVFVTYGGLLSYGSDQIDQFRRAAGYVDRILRGEKPADLPVQNPVKHELVINLKTAKALGLEVPPSLLARADEVIE